MAKNLLTLTVAPNNYSVCKLDHKLTKKKNNCEMQIGEWQVQSLNSSAIMGKTILLNADSIHT